MGARHGRERHQHVGRTPGVLASGQGLHGRPDFHVDVHVDFNLHVDLDDFNIDDGSHNHHVNLDDFNIDIGSHNHHIDLYLVDHSHFFDLDDFIYLDLNDDYADFVHRGPSSAKAGLDNLHVVI